MADVTNTVQEPSHATASVSVSAAGRRSGAVASALARFLSLFYFDIMCRVFDDNTVAIGRFQSPEHKACCSNDVASIMGIAESPNESPPVAVHSKADDPSKSPCPPRTRGYRGVRMRAPDTYTAGQV